MKALHRPELLGWSRFDEARNLDFHSVFWKRGDGNVLIDPLLPTAHDRRHIEALGGAKWIVVTNSDHLRSALVLKRELGATLAGPAAEKEALGSACDLLLGEGDEPVPGLKVRVLEGSKTPGELALLLEETTLITGDLIRGHRGGYLNLLPDTKLGDKQRAIASVKSLLAHERIDAVLVGDGWPVFRDGHLRLRELVQSLEA